MLFFSSNRRTASWTGSQALIGCFWILCAWLVSALDGRDDSADHGVILVAHVGGFKPLYGIQNPPVSLDKRQSTCASNGSNYCFGDDVNFCASCGICCGSSASSGYCCGSDQLCCGSACCASGQTCTDGECFLPLETVTVTDATQVTVSHVATQVVTVVQAVISTSTIFSTTVVTVTTGGTETDIVYVTVTAGGSAKREVVVEVFEPRHDGLWDTVHLFYKRFSFPWTADIARRSGVIKARAEVETQSPQNAVSSSTVITTRITQTSDITNFVSQTTTVPTSSIVLTTITQTKTRVLNAQTTITTTSTLTVTPQAAITETITQTATKPPASGTSDPGSSSTSSQTSQTGAATDPSSSGLSNKAIAGIAGGVGGAAVLVIVAGLLFWWRRRQRNRAQAHQDPSSYLEPYIPDMSSSIPPPRKPASPNAAQMNRFTASAPHHADGGIGGLAAAGAGVAGAGAMKPDRYSGIAGGPGQRKSVSPRLPDMAEAPGGEVYEADGTERPREVYEADSGRPSGAPYPVDDVVSPVHGHQRNVSGVSGASSGGNGYEMEGSAVSPLQEMEGTGSERLRNTNPYRQPGAYRDF